MLRAAPVARMSSGGRSRQPSRQQPTSNKKQKLNERADDSGNDSGDDDDSGNDSGDDDDSAGGGIGLNARMFEWCMFYEVGTDMIHFPGNSSDSIILHQYVCLLTATM